MYPTDRESLRPAKQAEKGIPRMDQPKSRKLTSVPNARTPRRGVYADDDGGDEGSRDTGMIQPIAVLARIPNLGSGPSAAAIAAPESVGTYRLLSQALSFRLLAGTTILLMAAAIVPYAISKVRSSSRSSTASGERAAWQPEVPAPTADMAPAWNPPGAVAQSDKAQGGMASAAAPAPVTSEAKPGNPGTSSGPQNVNTANVVGVNPAATTRAPIRVAEAVRAAPQSEQGSLNWKSFSRQFDEQHAPAGSLAPRENGAAIAVPPGSPFSPPPAAGLNAPAAQSSANSSMILNQGMTSANDRWARPSTTAAATPTRSEGALPTYPATNTPNPLTVGPSIASPSGNDQPVYSCRKQP